MEPTKDLKTQMAEALDYLVKGFALMVNINGESRSRELSVAITELETAMMWLNKDRAMRGFLEKNDTHVEVNNA